MSESKIVAEDFPINVFVAQTTTARVAYGESYLHWLRALDGVPDIRTFTSTVRERLFKEIADNPVRWEGPPPVDPACFDRNANDQDAADLGLDPRTLWAVLSARSSRHEQYAVRYLASIGRYDAADPDHPQTYIDVQEHYHARILEELLRTLCLEPRWRPPPALGRFMLRQIVRLPPWLSDMSVLCGELVGVAVFSLLREHAGRLFAEQPTACARIERLLDLILLDEIGHVYYLRSRLGQGRLWLCRLALPLIARVLMADMPEGARLFGYKPLLDRILHPEVLRWLPEGQGGMPLWLEAKGVGGGVLPA